MSNLEAAPAEVTCSDDIQRGRVLDARLVPLGGPRAMTLPQRERSLIGAWCFIDHYGPDDASVTGGMRVPGHPHTGLQTVSWLFSGTVDHRDTVGTHAIVRPGELNLMTAGSGIAHSEFSTPSTTLLHGAQLWLALPEGRRDTESKFEHYAPPVLDREGARVLVFLGALFGQMSPVPTFSPLLGAELTLRPGQTLQVPVNRVFEHGVLIDTGAAAVNGIDAVSGQLVYWPTGAEALSIRASAGQECRVLLLGGEPLGEQIVMWWNFIGRTHDEIAAFREQWEQERTAADGPGRFGNFPEEWPSTLAAPRLPNARLRPRR